MVDCPECNCTDTAEVTALKQQAAAKKSEILARQKVLLGQISALRAELAALQAKNTEYLRPRADICAGVSVSSTTPQSLNDIKTYRFGNKCGG